MAAGPQGIQGEDGEDCDLDLISDLDSRISIVETALGLDSVINPSSNFNAPIRYYPKGNHEDIQNN